MQLGMKLVLLLIVILLLRILYLYSVFYQKHKMIGNILITWKIKTNGGYIQKDKRHSYKDDYFLSQTINDYDTHIHLITHKEDYSIYELIKLVFFQYSKIIFLEYIVKKNNVHSHLTQIDYYNDSYLDICEQMEYLLFGE